jgi:hypothetical protein
MTNTIDKKTEDLIINNIKNKAGSHYLMDEYRLSYSQLHKLSKKRGVLDIFKLNNREFAKKKRLENTKYNHDQINKIIDQTCGSKIYKSVIYKKYTTGDLKNKFKLPTKKLIRFLKYKKIYDVAIRNGKEKIGSLARINGKLSRLTLKGIELKPITPEIVEKFEYYKTTLVYKQKVYDAIKKEFGFGDKKIKQLCQRFGYPKDNPQSGQLNPMYGKSPSKKSGVGIKSHLMANGKLYFCRSLLELKIYLYMLDNNLKFVQSKHRVKYRINGVDKTYCPDIVMGDSTICEIKPSALINLKENQLKFESLKKYCSSVKLKCKFITENDFDLKKYSEWTIFKKLIDDGILIIDTNNLEKLKRNL